MRRPRPPAPARRDGRSWPADHLVRHQRDEGHPGVVVHLAETSSRLAAQSRASQKHMLACAGRVAPRNPANAGASQAGSGGLQRLAIPEQPSNPTQPDIQPVRIVRGSHCHRLRHQPSRLTEISPGPEVPRHYGPERGRAGSYSARCRRWEGLAIASPPSGWPNGQCSRRRWASAGSRPEGGSGHRRPCNAVRAGENGLTRDLEQVCVPLDDAQQQVPQRGEIDAGVPGCPSRSGARVRSGSARRHRSRSAERAARRGQPAPFGRTDAEPNSTAGRRPFLQHADHHLDAAVTIGLTMTPASRRPKVSLSERNPRRTSSAPCRFDQAGRRRHAHAPAGHVRLSATGPRTVPPPRRRRPP